MRAARRPKVPLVVCARRYLYEGEVPDFQREACENLLGYALTARLGAGPVSRDQIAAVVAEQAADGLPHINLVGEPVVTLFERRAFQRCGGVDGSYVQLWDYEVMLRLSMRRGLVLVADPLASFRVHAGSETARNFSSQAFRINVMDRLALHLAYARDRRFRPVRRAALDLDPPADLLAQAYGVLQAARRLADRLPPERVGEAHALLGQVSAILPTPPPGPAGDVAFRAEEALFHEISSGPWMGLADQAAHAADPPPSGEPDHVENESQDTQPNVVASEASDEEPLGAAGRPASSSRAASRLLRPLRPAGRVARSLRANQWWGHMLGPIVAFAALQLGWRQIPPGTGLIRVVAIVASAVALASYAYVVNDAADVTQDRLAGKRNSMARLSVPLRLVVIAGFAVLGFLPWTVLHLPRSAMAVLVGIYLMPLLYSAYPVRLKERHILGPVADATNAFVLPALFTIAVFSAHGRPAGPAALMVVGSLLWTAAFGLRAIVKHQIDDAVNDRRSGANTWVLQVGEGQAIRFVRNVAFPAESVGLGLLVVTVAWWSWGTAALGIGSFVFIRALLLGGKVDPNVVAKPLAWGGWLYWQQIWPALLVSLGLAVWDPWYLLLTSFIAVLFWPRLRRGLGSLRYGARDAVRRVFREQAPGAVVGARRPWGTR